MISITSMSIDWFISNFQIHTSNDSVDVNLSYHLWVFQKIV